MPHGSELVELLCGALRRVLTNDFCCAMLLSAMFDERSLSPRSSFANFDRGARSAFPVGRHNQLYKMHILYNWGKGFAEKVQVFIIYYIIKIY